MGNCEIKAGESKYTESYTDTEYSVGIERRTGNLTHQLEAKAGDTIELSMLREAFM